VSDPATSDPAIVRLELPAHPRFVAAARVVATSLGAEAGFSVDDLDDLRLAVGELVATLIDGAPASARVGLDYSSVGDLVTVRGRVDGADEPLVADELTRRILSAVTDSFELSNDSFSLTKSSQAEG